MFTNSSVESVRGVGTAAARVFPPEESVERGPTAGQRESSETPRSSEVTEVSRTEDAERKKRVVKEQHAPELPNAVAQKVAKHLEDAINAAHGKEIKFRVLAQAESESESLSFTVVDRETGKVVREFPPDRVKTLTERSALEDGHGVFVDEAV